MGKVVTAIATVAVFVLIAVYAPELVPAFLVHAVGTAAALAITTAVLSVAAGLAIGLVTRALTSGNVPKAALTAPPRVPTAVVGLFGSIPKRRLQPRMDVIRGGLRHRAYRAWFGRFQLLEFVGDCLNPSITDRYAIADLDADLRRGDLMSFSVTDVKTAFPEYGTSVITKRFLGLDVENGILRFDCTKPPRTIETSLDNVLYAHRVRATAPTLKEARRLFKKVRRNPTAYDTPMMA